MRAIALVWIGIPSQDYQATVGLFRDALGLEVEFEEPDTVELSFPAGERVQVFAPGHRYHERFAGATAVPLFEVDDLRAAEERLLDAGCELVAGRESDAHWEWLEFRAPDGNLYSVGTRRG